MFFCFVRAAVFLTVVEAQLTNQALLRADLDYGTYMGVHNATSNLSVWKGIRYAAPPIGKLRWQAPQGPAQLTTPVLADTFGAYCPQSSPAFPSAPLTVGNEDCLFLNVYSPVVNTSDPSALLPVLVWIHGGGYGEGTGRQDMSGFINMNENALVAVSIQYRVCSFQTRPVRALLMCCTSWAPSVSLRVRMSRPTAFSMLAFSTSDMLSSGSKPILPNLEEILVVSPLRESHPGQAPCYSILLL